MGWWLLRLSAKILAILRLSVNFFQLRLTKKWRGKSDNPGNEVESTMNLSWGRGGGVLPYIGYIGMCRCEGYGFQTDIQSNFSLLTGTSIILTPLYYGQFVWSL